MLISHAHNDQFFIYKQPIDQDTGQAIPTGSLSATVPRLSADGEWIVYIGYARNDNHARIMRVRVSGGISEFIFGADRLFDHQCGRAPGGCVIVERVPNGTSLTVTAFDPVKGRGKLLRTIKEAGNELSDALAPDGAILAITNRDENEGRIRLLSLSNNIDRDITVEGWTNLTGLTWTSDGKGLYCGSVSSRGQILLYVDLKGRAQIVRQYKGPGAGLFWGLPSPDGHDIAILEGTLESNISMLGGF